MDRKQFLRRSALFSLAAAGVNRKAVAFTGERKSWYLSERAAGTRQALYYTYEVRVYNSDLLQPAEDAKIILPLTVYGYTSVSGTIHITSAYNFNRRGAPQKEDDHYLISFDASDGTGADLRQSFPEVIHIKLKPEKELILETYKDNFISLPFHADSDDGCFLTTACTAARGLPDNCAELQAMRFLRDEHLMKTKDGVAMVRDYYRIAPAVVENINLLPNKDQLWSLLYNDLVLPAKQLVEAKRFTAAAAHYSMYVTWVKALFSR